MTRYICIHGHFYQPAREDPWLEAIEREASAAPYHDWNERITAECYLPNATARLLDREGQLADIINNFARISFNVGPTLMSWLEKQAPEVYLAILAADWESQARFSGHGGALAQAYNHMILPLANDRDRRTQVRWGVRDFRHRFGRVPEGMWLPETAVDLPTLETLADEGIRFTILAPHQARRVRPMGSFPWTDVTGGRIDTTMPYRQTLPSGRTIDLFFYNGAVARAVAFEGLLSDGAQFSERLLGGFSDQRSGPQIVHIATDGESYGHHHRFGEMALAFALRRLASAQPSDPAGPNAARLTVYGEYLARHPPTREVEVLENTSWSCAHGIERWRADCGCHSGNDSWNQGWRAPLRAALDELRDAVAPQFEAAAGAIVGDPWAARDDYINVMLMDTLVNLSEFLERQDGRPDLTTVEAARIFPLLAMQRHCMLMYTSCGWFFDDISGIETVQVLKHAGRVIQFARDLFGEDGLEGRFRRALAAAKSNVPERRDGTHVYDTLVKPAMGRARRGDTRLTRRGARRLARRGARRQL